MSSSFELGFVFSKLPADSPGYVSADDLLYPGSWRLVRYGNIELSAIQSTEAFYSAATVGSFENNVLRGLWDYRINSDHVRLLSKQDGTFSLTADNAFSPRGVPDLPGSFRRSSDLAADAVDIWPLSNVNGWDQLLVHDPSATGGVLHFKIDFDKPSIHPMLVVNQFTSSGAAQTLGLRFEGGVFEGLRSGSINLHEVLLENGQVALLFSIRKLVPNNQGGNDAVDTLWFTAFNKALLQSSPTLSLPKPTQVATRSQAFILNVKHLGLCTP